MNIILKKASEESFERIFKLLCECFPEDEYRPKSGQKALFNKKEYAVYLGFADGCFAGFLAVWTFDRFSFIEHFAVAENLRGKGIGAKMLAALFEIIDGQIYLEVEPPEDETKRRRIAFYERNGFRLTPYSYNQPPFSLDRAEVPLLVMSRFNLFSDDEFEIDKAELFKEVYGIEL